MTESPLHLPFETLFSIQGKTVICTGVTGEIGRELCTTLAQAGANIVSIELQDDPNTIVLQDAVKTTGRTFRRFECDISNSRDLRSTFSEIWEAGIVPDILLNCAGVNRRGTVEQLEDEAIDLVRQLSGIS